MEHEVSGHSSGGGFPPFDQIDTFPAQIFWLVVLLGVLYFALSSVLLPKLARAIEDRDDTIAGNVAEAAAASSRADAAIREFESKIAEAKARGRETAARAKAESDARIAAESARADAALDARLSAAERRIADVRAAAMNNVAGIAEVVAGAMVERLSGAAPVSSAVQKSVAKALSATRTES